VTGASGSVTTSPSGLTVNVTGVTTKAGWPGSAGSANGTGWAARFAYPGSVRTDASGNVFVADSYNNTIREVTPGGVVTTVAGTPGVAGSKDGPVATALFDGPAGVAVDAGGNIFVADDSNYTIREISAAGTVSTLAGSAGSQGEVDGTGSAARFYDPQNLAIDAAGNLYVADGLGNSIRKVTPAGVVTTIAGSSVGGSADGTGAQAGFRDPTGIAVDASGNVYVADNGNNTIRLITPAGVVTTIAGSSRRSGSADGTGTAATFDGPAGVGVDNWGNVYVADALNCTIRKIAPGNVVTTIAGSAGVAENIDGLPANARFYTPGDVTVDGSGVLYVADTGNETIRRLIPGSVATAPTITTQPAGQSVNAGASVTFATAIAGTPPFSFQWYFNGNTIAGATGSSLVLANVQQAQGGTYTLSVANAEGSVTSSAATLTVAAPSGFPDITVQPQGGTLASGGSVVLSVTATGTGPFTYQWFLNGTAIPGATASTYTVTTAGSYTVAVTNATGTATSSAAVVSLSSRLVNISGRALVGTGANIAIAGFVIDGPAGSSKQMLIRGVGPQLAALGVGSVLAQPTIALFNSSGTVIASNTGWGTNANAAQIATVAAQVGAFALPAGSADSALLVNLAPGVYTVELSGLNSTTGVGLVELYEVNPSDAATLGNISTRAQVGTGGNILFAGFVITGTQPATVLVRGVGPVLGTLGVANYLAQPILNVFNSSGTAIATNVGWSTNANAAQIATVSTQVGAYPLPAGSADSALLLTLPPGAYTTEIAGANGTIGVALAEVYFVPP
jgi:sugar lactone lactonase YvrE